MKTQTLFLPNSSFLRIIIFSAIMPLLLIGGLISSVGGQICGTPGHLDTSFGSGGIVKTDFRNFRDAARAVAIQSDGKIVAGGYSGGSNGSGGTTDFSLARYNIDGSLDTSFGNGGKVITVVSSSANSLNRITSIKIQTDGKIVAGGPGITGAVLVRYNPNGSLDSTFGSNGIATANFPTLTINSMTMQSDGKFIMVGSRITASEYVFAIIRFNANGSLDTTFGNSGLVTTNFSAFDDIAYAVEVSSDGKIVAAGVSYTDSQNRQFAIARYNSDGSLDTTFGNGGKVVAEANPNYRFNSAFSLAIQADNKLLVGGATLGAGILRLNTNGSRDTSFGNNGLVIATQTGVFFSSFDSLRIDSAGRILGTGTASSTLTGNASAIFAVVRFNTNGTQDSSFGNNGITITDFGMNTEIGYSIAIQSDGKIILAGQSSQTNTNNSDATADFTLLRYFGNACTSQATKPFDFDGDGKADVSVFRPSDGAWYLNQSQNGFTGINFGSNGDLIAPADYDGDGKTDLAVFRPSNGTWYLQRSTLGFTGVAFGTNGDLPVPADYDGDGKAELAVFRPSSGTWYILNITNNQFTAVSFGQNGDQPAAADYDGDGKTDVAVFRPSNGTWYLQRSQLGFTGAAFGTGGDKPVPADYDADGKADLAVFRPSNGTWYLQQSTAGFTGIQFGSANDLPVAADYDGDGKADVAVFRSGIWYLNRSTQGFTGVSFGTSTDKPVPNAFVP